MNSYDSDRMSDMLISDGHQLSHTLSNANIIIFNTCSIREKADQKLFSDLGRARPYKERATLHGEPFIMIVTGCVAQSAAENIYKRAPYVDVVLGTQSIHLLSSSIKSALDINNSNLPTDADNKFTATTLDAKAKFEALNLSSNFQHDRGISAFLTIQEGCNNFCTYCVVPITRGREFSRPVASVIDEAKLLIKSGVKEITVLGQNVSSYNGQAQLGKTWQLPRLLLELADIDGLERIRYTTSNPKDINQDFADAHKKIEKLMPFVHLPAQSGSDKILKKMNRKYTVDEYLKSLDLLQCARNDIAFSSDFIVGFPGETDEDFCDTMKLIGQANYAQAYSFKYSRRPNTPATNMEDQIEENVKSERLQILQDALNENQNAFNKRMIGECVTVLFTKDGRHKGQIVGRSEYSQSVSVCGSNIYIGDIAKVRITQAASHSLIGVLEDK